MAAQERNYRLTVQLLRSVKRRLREVLGPDDEELASYYRSYKGELAKVRTSPSSREEFAAAAVRSKVTLVGDFHTLEHAQRTFLFLLQDAEKKKCRPILGLEMVNAKFNAPLNRFVKGRIGEGEFLEEIRYFETWGFDFAHYKPILDHARHLKLAVHGLNTGGPLAERDHFMAHRIRHGLNEYPGQPIFILVGDLHVASEHLPRELDELGITPVVLFQNSEQVYLKKLKRGLEPVGFWRIGKSKFLSNNTAPQVKMQGYLTWLEHGGEALCQMYGYTGLSEAEGEIELSDTVIRYASALQDLFGLRGPLPSDFQVYQGASLSFLEDEYFSSGPGKRYATLVRDARSAFVLKGRILYVPLLDLNRTVEETTHLLMDVWLPTGRGLGAFLSRVHYFAGGFLGSKLLNPTRPAPTAHEMRRYIDAYERMKEGKDKGKLSREARVYEGALAFLRLLKCDEPVERRALSPILKADWNLVYEVSRAVGYSLAQRLYELYNAGDLSALDLRRYVFEQANAFYLLGVHFRVA